MRRFVFCASLAALPKDDGDLRPIAVGEVFRRLASKCLASVSRESARSLLEPSQLGVGSRRACEAIVHVVRKWFNVHAEDHHRVLAQIDLANAFNTVERHALLEAARAFMPSLVPWVDCAYGQASFLLIGDAEIDSVGTHWGCCCSA